MFSCIIHFKLFHYHLLKTELFFLKKWLSCCLNIVCIKDYSPLNYLNIVFENQFIFFFLFFHLFLLVGGQLLYNIIVVFAIHWHESAMDLHVFPIPIPRSYLPLHPIPLGLLSAPGPSTCLMHPTWPGHLFHHR